ncbi:MAG: N-acetylmuramoyl-L-alanine amidase [Lachnospiraceae bacterium]|nr:N-acetylmuramoyl-L-alanine amidase [Lachnospiraceae bacterium]
MKKIVGKIKTKKVFATILMIAVLSNLVACVPDFGFLRSSSSKSTVSNVTKIKKEKKKEKKNEKKNEKKKVEIKETEKKEVEIIDTTTPLYAKTISFDMSCPYATYSVINSGTCTLYKPNPNYLGDSKIVPRATYASSSITIAVNAGHGTKDGDKVKTYCHPDFSEKVATGTTKAGELKAIAVSGGTILKDGMKEADVNLLVACALKDKLLASGYSVLMIRESDDVQLDNVARTVLANKYADAHIAIHFDSTKNDKGIFYISPANVKSYRNMEPLKSNLNRIIDFGTSVINTFKNMGQKIYGKNGYIYGDLTQLSYSTIPSIDIELGDKGTTIDEKSIDIFAEGIKKGIDVYFKKN